MITIDENLKKEVGARLRSLRVSNKLSIDALIDKLQNEYYLDIDEKTIRRYEKGEFLPKIDNLICFAELFNSSLDYIIYGKETSNDNSFTYYDNFKRLNRLIYSLSVNFVKDNKTGKCYLELWEDEFKVYWERLNSFGVSENYLFEKRNANPVFDVKKLDDLFDDFKIYTEQLSPTLNRYNKMLLSMGISPKEFLEEKLAKIKKT